MEAQKPQVCWSCQAPHMLLELAELHKTNPKTSLTRDQRQHLSAILGSSDHPNNPILRWQPFRRNSSTVPIIFAGYIWTLYGYTIYSYMDIIFIWIIYTYICG